MTVKRPPYDFLTTGRDGLRGVARSGPEWPGNEISYILTVTLKTL
jgi:hypothetical protein